MSYDCNCKPQCENFREHVGFGPHIAAKATPSRNNVVREAEEREARWNKDRPAYKRLREEGLQPKHIEGSAEMEARAQDEIEITTGRRYGKAIHAAKEMHTVAAEISAAQKKAAS